MQLLYTYLSYQVKHINAAIELQFTQEIYPVNEDEGSVEVCIEIVTDGFLTEDFEINIMTQDGNATG